MTKRRQPEIDYWSLMEPVWLPLNATWADGRHWPFWGSRQRTLRKCGRLTRKISKCPMEVADVASPTVDKSSAAQPPTSIFVASGSVWFALLAIAMLLVAMSAHFQGWKKVTSLGGTLVDRYTITETREDGGGEWTMIQVIIFDALAIGALGFILGLVSLLPRRRSVRLSLTGVFLNILVFVVPFLLPKAVFFD